MALSGVLLADFESFYNAVQKAQAELVGFDSGANRVEKSLNRMADQFSGRKVISEATLMTKAIEDIGGASKLTEGEMVSVNAVLTEAIGKFGAIGQTAPKNMVALADATADAAKQSGAFHVAWSDIFTIFTGMTAARIGEQLVSEIVNIGKEAFTTADQLTKLHDQTGISVEALQDLQAAGADAGVELGTIAGAVTKLQQELGSGDDGAAAAIAALHLNLADLKTMEPGEMFLTVARALGEIKDPLEFARVGAELFGKKWVEIKPLITAGLQEIGDGTTKMSRESIKALDDAGDAWGRFWNATKVNVGEAIADVLTLSLASTRELKSEFGKMTDEVVKRAPDLKNSIAPPGLPADIDAITKSLEAERRQILVNAEDAAMAIDTAIALAGTLGDVHTAAHATAMKQEKDLAEERAKNLKIRNDETIDALTKLQKMEADVADANMKLSLSETDYKVAKVWQWADDTIAAYKGMGAQAAAYADAVYTRASQMQDAIYAETKAIEAQGDAYADLAKDAVTTFATIGGGATQADGAVQALGGTLVLVADNMDALNRQLSSFYDQFTQFGELGATNNIGTPGAVGGYRTPGMTYGVQTRAAGGPVAPGATYLVGERGPELFKPAVGGTIVPNGEGAGTIVHNTFYVNGSIRDLAQPLMDELTRRMKQTRQWPAAT